MGNPIINLIGQRFGRLIAFEKTDKRNNAGCVIWKCLCDCGKETFVNSGSLRNGHIKSCGCLGIEKTKERSFKHGHSPKGKRSGEYNTWRAMKIRCLNPKHERFKDYGGRGIRVCDEWKNSFENFLAYLKANDMYPRPVGTSIDRYPNNDGNYEPGNIQWATRFEQNHNRRS
jgi:hypothetical protein